MIPELEDDRLDQSLRSKFEQFAPPPTGKVWPGIAPHIGPPPLPRRRRRPVPLPFLFGLTALLAGLAGWLLPHGITGLTASKAVGQINLPVAADARQQADGMPIRSSGTLSQNSGTLRQEHGTTNRNDGTTNREHGTPSRNDRMPSRGSGMLNQHSGTRHLTPALAIQPVEDARTNEISRNMRVETASASSSATATAPATQPAAGVSASGTITATADSLPATLRPLATLEHQTLAQLPSTATLAAGPLAAESRTRFIGTLRRERAELLRLQRRTDSLLLALGDLPGTAPAIAAVAAPAADSTKKPAIKHRWSVLLTATPEQNTLTLQGPENDPLTALRRNHETGRAGFSAAALAEYQLTSRMSVGGGLGYSTFGADLRVTNKKTDVSVTYNTTTTTSTNVYTSTNQTYSVRIIQVPQQSPIFNSSGQVIGYQTVYVPRQDTVYSTIVQHDTVRTTNHVTTPLISKKETLTTKLLQPNYRFATLPLLVRYRFSLGPGRWWADVSAGAQLQFFLGGTQVVTDDGETFRTQTITAGNGPFRPLNVALSGSLALNYALTNRLSVSVAPSMRWQALSVYKAETGLIQQPTATGLQLGVRFKL
jgi:hypothetical protein